MSAPYVLDFTELKLGDVPKVGGKNASLGEMLGALAHKGVRVPGGFATTADAYRSFLQGGGLKQWIDAELDRLDVEDVTALARAGQSIRAAVANAPLPVQLEAEIREHYARMSADSHEATVAVRSSATAEDLPDASFAGQQETFLNICGIDNVLHAIKEVFASLYNDRAIAYRVHKGFAHANVALSAGIQRMVRSDIGAAGVMFTIDTESGFRDAVFINAAWGLGETVVQGSVNPDEYYVHKPRLADGFRPVLRRHLGDKATRMIFDQGQSAGTSTVIVSNDTALRERFVLSDDELLELARHAMTIETHYQRPMDIEWAKDGNDGQIYIVQARPETVKSREGGQVLVRYRMLEKGEVQTIGRAIGNKIASGVIRKITSAAEMDRVQPGDILVTTMTDPDWEPVMKRAAAIVTDRGGRTCHAAIIARELGVPAVVGCIDATQRLHDGETATVSCAEGEDGRVYRGLLKFEKTETPLDNLPPTPVKIMMNVGNPEQAFHFASLPNDGIGLARLEFIINNEIGIHPGAALTYPAVDTQVKAHIERRMRGYASPVDFYVNKLAEGIATLGAAFWPNRVIARMSDFKSNEYANLPGGYRFEPHEENPMIGLRGASRYVHPTFQRCFELECRAMRKVRGEMGLSNVEIMIPFCRTVDEADRVLSLMAEFGLKRGENGLKIIMMCEIPANVILADQFLERFDGYSIGSNDLTQLTLGLDRDSELVAHLFDERNDAVTRLIASVIKEAKARGKYIGICGQGPSDHLDFAKWLIDQGIDSLSLNPDSVLPTRLALTQDLHP